MASYPANTGSEEDMAGDLFSDCFWEIKGYKQVVQRIDDGARLTDGLAQMLSERAELELKYAKGLKQWSRKWEDAVNKSPEYGTLESAMKSLTVEANETADIHLDVRQKVNGSLLESIKHWKNSNYQKAFVKWKQTAAAQEGFDKAQRPWAKRFVKVEKAKKTYHLATRTLEQHRAQLQLYESDPMTATDQIRKMKDKISKAESESDKTRDKYKDRLSELDMANQQYINEMTVEFEKCQAMEKLRMEFFGKTLEEYLGHVDISQNPRLRSSFQNIQYGISGLTPDEDLKKYADSKGTGMDMGWPTFTEYDEKDSYPPIGRMAMKDDEPAHFPVYSDPPPAGKKNPFNGGGFEDGDSEWGDTLPPPSHHGPPSSEVRVMAMFDYTGAEADELSFKEGDVLVQLDEEDENGWCRGRYQGVEGLYPASYVQRIK